MPSSQPGETISAPDSPTEVTHISTHGFWLLAHGKEYFLPYEAFPWFRQARIDEILTIEEPSHGHLHWPKLDVDLTFEMIKEPGRFPLVARVR